MTSTRDLGEQLTKVCLETASRDNATYADFRLVNTMVETVSMINENPATEESNDLGAGIRVLYQNAGWGYAGTDELDPENIRETTRKALALARGAAKIGSKVALAKGFYECANGDEVRASQRCDWWDEGGGCCG